jgi:hypothetical protein
MEEQLLLIVRNLLREDHIAPNYWQVVIKHVLLLRLTERHCLLLLVCVLLG